MGPSGSAAISLYAEEQIQANTSRHVSTANTVFTAVEQDKAVQHGTEAASLASPSLAPPAYEEIGGVPRTPVVEKLS
jgi:hypothetical protein